MATIAVGDIHGQSGALKRLLDKIRPELGADDTVVFLGDYIDRGPDSRGCIEQILQLKCETSAGVIALLGNHEQWMLRSLHDPTRHSWLPAMEALVTVQSYSEEAAAQLQSAMEELGFRLFLRDDPVALPYNLFFDAMPKEHLEFFQNLKPYHRTKDVTCVHGGMHLDGSCEATDENVFVWGPLGFPEEYRGAGAVVYGHRGDAIVRNGAIRPNIGNNRTYGIDSIAHGVLTAMRFPDLKVFQAGIG